MLTEPLWYMVLLMVLYILPTIGDLPNLNSQLEPTPFGIGVAIDLQAQHLPCVGFPLGYKMQRDKCGIKYNMLK